MKIGGSREVLILDDDADLRASLGEILSEFCDRSWLGAASVAEVMALGARALACELIIVDINLGARQPSGLEAYEWLRAHGFEGRIYFLTGHAEAHPLVQRALSHQRTRLFEKPITFEAVCSFFDEAT